MSWLAKYKNTPESPIRQTDRTDTNQNITPEKLFKQALDRLNAKYGPEDFRGFIAWGENNAPSLLSAMDKAQDNFDKAANRGDLEACRGAIKDFEKAVDELIKAYNKRELSVDEAISLFKPEKAWKLPKEKADILERVFDTPEPIRVGGFLWHGGIK